MIIGRPAANVVVMVRPASDMRCPTLVGRTAECAAIDDLLGRAAAGRGGVATVEGDAGVDESRLVQAAAKRGGRRDDVLTGAGDTGTAAAFRRLAEVLLAASRDGHLAGSADLAANRGALGRLVPEWAVPVAPAE